MLHRSRSRLSACASLAALCWSAAGIAQANGAFPAAGQILVDPTDPQRIWVNTAAGFALTQDGGATFHLVCTQAVGYSGFFHPHAAVTPTGAIFMGVPTGVAVGRGDACDFTLAPELLDVFVVDVSVDPQGRAIAVGVPAKGGRAKVFRSEDDLASWQQLGNDLPNSFTPRTVDAAPSDPDVVYVSGLDESNAPKGTLVHTLDGGNSWEGIDVPGSDSADFAPFIAGVDPALPARMYVRLGGAPGRLLRSDDAGVTFTQILELPGILYAFRLSADGSSAFVGSDQSGLHRLDTTSLALDARAAINARCVMLDGARVLACGDETNDGFSAGISSDDGVTFDTLLRLSCIEGILPCPAGSAVEDTCQPQWPMIEDFLDAGLACDAPDPGGGGPGGSDQGGGGEGGSGQGAGSGASGGGASGGAGAGPDGDSDDGGGCSCDVGGAAHAPAAAWCAAALAALWLGRRRVGSK